MLRVMGLSTPVCAAAEQAYPFDALHKWQVHFLNSLLSIEHSAAKTGPGNLPEPASIGVLASLPTGSGKSTPAELLVLRSVLLHRRKALVVEPLVSLVQEKAKDFMDLLNNLVKFGAG